MFQYLDEKQKRQVYSLVVGILCLLIAYFAVNVISTIKGYSYIGRGNSVPNVIQVNGTGEVLAVPDTATFSFSVVESAKQMSDAQDSASKKMNSVIDTLKSLGVDEKDIKTTNYSSYPKYEYQNTICPRPMDVQTDSAGSVSAPSAVIYCPPGKSVLTGYEVNQTVTVKVRKTSEAGNILAKVGALNVSNISGIDFVVDDMDKVQAQARDKAIQDAKDKAKILSKSLGVDLSHIVNFYESGNYPVYANAYSMDSKVMGAGVAVTPPQLPTGENKITSNVTITYEVK